jgi:hypothetical protein
MLRRFFLFAGFLAATTLSAGGCRSCSNCHDYGPPVANCHCNSCGCHRAGSASGHVDGGYAPDPFESEDEYGTDGQLPSPELYDERPMDQPEGVR